MPPEQPSEIETAKAKEAQRVITVRLPAPLHRELKHEARTLSLERGEDISMNRLCVEKLRKPL